MLCYQGFVLSVLGVSQFLPQFIILIPEFKQQESDTGHRGARTQTWCCFRCHWSDLADNLPPRLWSQRESVSQ